MQKTGHYTPCLHGNGTAYGLPKPVTPGLAPHLFEPNRDERKLANTLLKHAGQFYGKEAAAEAWEEFSLWRGGPMDQTQELKHPFSSWFLFNWQPDNTERPKANHLPEMPIAKHYLRYTEDQLVLPELRFIEEAFRRQFSFYVVLEMEPCKTLTLRDLFCREQITISEKLTSCRLLKGDILFARVLLMEGDPIIYGCAPFAIPASFQAVLVQTRDHIETHAGALNQRLLVEYDYEIRELYHDIRDELNHS